jgi:ferredoxin--NADP+ reductase
VPSGELTPVIWGFKEGDEVLLRSQARGSFTMDRSTGCDRHVMIGTVTGIAPFLSMVRDLKYREAEGHPPTSRVLMLHGASRSFELSYLDELQRLERTVQWFHYVPTVSRPWEDPSWTGERGRCEDVLRKHLDDPRSTPKETTVYLCGNPNMIKNARGILERAGYSRDQIRTEAYASE